MIRNCIFDDYETQLYKYYEDKKIEEVEDNTRAIYEAEDDAYDSYVRYHESQNTKPKYSIYYVPMMVLSGLINLLLLFYF